MSLRWARRPACRLPFLLGALLLLPALVAAAEPVRIGVHHDPPLTYLTADGRVGGIFAEVLAEVAAAEDWRLQLVHGTPAESRARLQRGEVDLVARAGKRASPPDGLVANREPVLLDWGMVYARSDDRVTSFLDLDGRAVAVARDDVHGEAIRSLTEHFEVSCRFVAVDGYREVLRLVDAKQVDAGAVGRLFGSLHGDDFALAATPIVFDPRPLGLATRADSDRGRRLLAATGAHLAAAKADPQSAYHRILSFHLGGGSGRWRDGLLRHDEPLGLSPAQRQWIAAHPRIRFSVDPGFAPFEFLDDERGYHGMAADFLHLIASKTGLEFELVRQDDWPAAVAALRERRIDLLPCIGYGERRDTFIAYSEPYLRFARVIVTRSDADIAGLADLADRRVVVQAHSSHHAFLQEQTTIDAPTLPDFEDALLAVSRGEADATVGNLATVTHLVGDMTLTNLKVAGYADPEPQALSMGVREDWPELAGIIDQALARISNRERREILDRWVPLPTAAAAQLDLTEAEREWLLMHPRVTVAWDSGWAPVEFAGPGGEARGISVDYLDAIEDMLGIRFDLDPAGDWQTRYEDLREGRLDMSSCIAITPERLEHLEFTQPYLDAPVVFFGRQDLPYLRGFDDIDGHRVAVVADYATDEWISRDHPEVELTRVASMADGFDRLASGDIDVLAGSVLVGNYYLSQRRDRGIKVAGETRYTYQLCMAVRDDWPIFAGILRKAIDAVPESDHTAFYRKWVWVEYEHGVDYRLLLRVGIAAGLALALFAFWVWRLRCEVDRRQRAQQDLTASEAALRRSLAEQRSLEAFKDTLTHMVVHDIRSPLSVITGSLELAASQDAVRTDPKLRDRLQVARLSAEQTAALAQTMLDLARLEAGEMPLRPAATDLQTLAAAACSHAAVQARRRDVQLACEGDAAPLTADAEVLRRVLDNLLSNAIKASPPGTTVAVTTGLTGDHATIEVRDRGEGIPEDLKDRLFDKFAAGGGRAAVGLGLAFCKLAVDAHGGSITVASGDAGGTTVRVALPRRVTDDPGAGGG